MAGADSTMAEAGAHREVAESASPGFGRSLTRDYWLLIGIILIQFFPLPVLPVIGLAPENFIFLVAVLFSAGKLGRLMSGGGYVSMIALLLLVFGGLEFAHDVLRGEQLSHVPERIRIVIYLLLLVEVCSNPRLRQQTTKLLVVVAAIQVVFGSLIYFWGEPFASVRGWMLQSSGNTERLISEGSRIAPLYGVPHIFGYLLAGFPFLAVSLYLQKKQLIWVAMSLVLLFGLFLNAERFAGAAFFIGLFYLLLKSSNRSRNLAILGAVLLAFVAMQAVVGSRLDAGASGWNRQAAFTGEGTLSHRFGATNVSDIVDRLKYQLHGIASVLQHPLIGPTQREYAIEVLGGTGLVSYGTPAEVMASHNHYVNVGIWAGIPGWLVLVLFLWALRQVHRRVGSAVGKKHPLRMEYLCISVGLAAVLGNAVFHNAGIFSDELATISIVGLLLSQYRQVMYEARCRLLRARELGAIEESGANQGASGQAS